MATFSKIFKKSFLEAFTGSDFSTTRILVCLTLTTLIALYIFVVYRVFTRKTFYSKSFNISLVAMTIITAAIILAMQSNLVISLGMVGALSIVRFRMAIKDPMDLVYLFWSVGVGIVCGAGLYMLAFLTSLLLTVVVLALDWCPTAKAPMILVVNCKDRTAEQEILDTAGKYSRIVRVKSRNVTGDTLNMVIEVRVKEESALLKAIADIPAIESSSLLSHDGEATF